MLWYIISLYIKLSYQRILVITFHYISFDVHQEQIENDLQLDKVPLNTKIKAIFCVRHSNSIAGVGFKLIKKNCYFDFYITNHFQQYSSYMFIVAINFIDGGAPWEKPQTWRHSLQILSPEFTPVFLWCWCRSIFSFLCSVLLTHCCLFVLFGHCIVWSSSIYGFRLPILASSNFSFQIKLYRVHLNMSEIELKTLVVTGCIGRCKSNYHTIWS